MTPRENRILGIPNRFIVLLLIILSIIFGYAVIPPILPFISLQPEVLTEPVPLLGGPFALTNTIVATVIADIILLLIGFIFYRAYRRAEENNYPLLSGFAGGLEALLEVLWDLCVTTAGKYAKKFFPWVAMIVLIVLVNNWLELIPGVDSFGWLEPAHGDVGYAPESLGGGWYYLNPAEEFALGGEEVHHEEEGHGVCEACHIVPFIRVASTDLNFTLAIALISVVVTHIFGVQALGASYFTKFFNTTTLFTKPIFGVIDFGVSLLEALSEFIIRTVAFTFRLFGNIFAGSVMLFVIGTLVPVFAQSMFLMLEFFVGLIQAAVFGMLTLTFMYMATLGHGHEEEH